MNNKKNQKRSKRGGARPGSGRMPLRFILRRGADVAFREAGGMIQSLTIEFVNTHSIKLCDPTGAVLYTLLVESAWRSPLEHE